MSIKIAPSLLSANFGNLQQDIEMINSSDADFLHIDIMDGVFVPNNEEEIEVLVEKNLKAILEKACD